jgi:hypothetical protein
MFRAFSLLAFAMLLAALTLEARSKEVGSAMVRRVQEKLAMAGEEAALQAVAAPAVEAVDARQRYLLIFAGKGARPLLVGAPWMSRTAIAKENGWIADKWPNSVTQQIEDTSSALAMPSDYCRGDVGVWHFAA